ncbi:DUF805 domain-containing protein [Staphylococcus nepalensis]|uniref:DUF805 domain-containing protein n=1 Tax=Staphylococcus nepalensis TaxID=214473 RepID=UPI000E1BCF64|nr:DUF805 domain-containing protein [Staphylococcus nepalensis]
MDEWVKSKRGSRRKEFWYPELMTFIISLVASVLNYIIPIPSILAIIIYWIFTIATYIANFSVSVRRFHDLGMSMLFPIIFFIFGIILGVTNNYIAEINTGSFLYTLFVIIGVIYIVMCIISLAICCTNGSKKENKYGKNPKEI